MHKGGDDRFGTEGLIRTQERLDRAFALRITSQHPANGQRRVADAIPQSRSCTPLDGVQPLSVPLDPALLPPRGWVSQERFQRRQSPS